MSRIAYGSLEIIIYILASQILAKCTSAQQLFSNPPPSSKCPPSPNNTTQPGAVQYASSNYNKLAQANANTAVAYWRSSETPAKHQLAFESICFGWLNTFAQNQPNNLPTKNLDPRPTAFWVHDTINQILIAKFIYLEKSDYNLISEATLISPLFRPLPSYHSDESSKHYSSCTLTFSTYINIVAQIEVSLVQFRTKATRQVWPPTGANDTSSGEVPGVARMIHHSLETISFGKTSTRQFTHHSIDDKVALWKQHSVVLPHGLEPVPYFIEFSAISGLVTGDIGNPSEQSHLDGIALSDISLSPACFGLNDIQYDQAVPLVVDWNSSLLADTFKNIKLSESTGFTGQQMSILVIVLILLLVAVIYCQSMLCTNNFLLWDQQNLHRNHRHGKQAIWHRMTCNICHLYALRPQNHRVYQAETVKFDRQHQNGVEIIDLKLNVNGDRGGLSVTNNSYCLPKQDQDLINLAKYFDELNRKPSTDGLIKPLNLNQIERDELRISKMLGKGAFGTVYEAEYLAKRVSNADSQRDGDMIYYSNNNSPGVQLVAVKMLAEERVNNPESLREFTDEALILGSTSHRNIVHLLGVNFTGKPLYMVMELMSGGNLKKFLSNSNKTSDCASQPLNCGDIICITPSPSEGGRPIALELGDLLLFSLDIARACDYIQRKNLIHRDLAARNCLLSLGNRPSSRFTYPTYNPFNSRQPEEVNLNQVYMYGYRDSGMVVKLADFGLTRHVAGDVNYYLMTMSKEVPVRWMAPECTDYKATSKSDVWSFGIVLWEIFSLGKLPYPNLKDNNEVLNILRLRKMYGFEQAKTVQQNDEPSCDYLIPDDQLEQTDRAIKSACLDEPPLPPPASDLPDSIYDLMCHCWANNPDLRPDFSEIAMKLYECLEALNKPNSSPEILKPSKDISTP